MNWTAEIDKFDEEFQNPPAKDRGMPFGPGTAE